MTRGRVYQRGRVWWVAFYWKGKERCESSRSTAKADAELLLARRLGEIGADQAGIKRWLGPEAEKLMVTALLDNLMQDYEVRGSRSMEAYKSRVKPLCESFYREQVRDVDTARLRRYIQERQRSGHQPATIKAELAMLHRAFTLAQQEGLIAQVPFFPTISVDNARQGFFEREDFEAVVALLPDYLQDVARFAYLSGWRKREVLDLQWKEIDIQGRVVRLDPERSKSKKGRTLALVGELWQIMERRYAARGLVPWVFHREGQRIVQPRKAWNTACRRAGVKGMVFHDMRRTTVRNLSRAGVPQAIAMAVTGHKTDSVYRRYDIVNEADIRQAQEKMQAYLKANQTERTILPLEGTTNA